MADIDDLRGTPSGHTASKSSNILKKAAVTVAIAANTIVGAPKVNASPTKEDGNNKDKIEQVVEQQPVHTDDGRTIDFETAAAQIQEQNQTADIENMENQASDMAQSIAQMGQNATLDKLGVEILYDKQDKIYYILGEDKNLIKISEDELNYGKNKAQYDLQQLKKFIHPTRQVNISVNMDKNSLQFDKKGNETKYADLQMQVGTMAAYVPQLNSIIKVAYEGAINNKELQDKLMQQANDMGESLMEHENSHRDDDKTGAFNMLNKSPIHMAKINMLTEIKANMVEAGIAYEYYKKTGSLDKFDLISNSDLTEVKQYLTQNPNAENCEALIAATVYKTWLEKNNKENTAYSKQAFQSVQEISNGAKHGMEYSAAAKLTDSQALENEYHKAVDKIFDNVPGLGDVRAQVNPDFSLNDGLVRQINGRFKKDGKVTALMNIVTSAAENVRQANRAIKKFLRPIRQADKDGERTETEQKKIDKKISRKMARLSGRIVNKTIKEVSGGNQQVKQSVAQTSQDISR